MEDYVRISRVLHEDDEFLTLEVAKDNDTYRRIREGDRFLSLVFVHGPDAEAWFPWEWNGE